MLIDLRDTINRSIDSFKPMIYNRMQLFTYLLIDVNYTLFLFLGDLSMEACLKYDILIPYKMTLRVFLLLYELFMRTDIQGSHT